VKSEREYSLQYDNRAQEMARLTERDVFIVYNPGSKRSDEELQKLRMPREGAFKERMGQVWVNSYAITQKPGLLLEWRFIDGFPWWAQVGFAGGTKYCDQSSQDPPAGKGREFYIKWNQEHSCSYPYLYWEHPVSKILKNLESIVDLWCNCANIPPQFGWVKEDFLGLRSIYGWFKQVNDAYPEALGVLDWLEVAWNSMTFEEARRRDDPNLIMADLEEIKNRIQTTAEEIFSKTGFEKKHAVFPREQRKH
jgi:hypothetical protein